MSALEHASAAVVSLLANDADFLALVGTDVGQISPGVPWVFQDTSPDEDRPFRDPKGTGLAAVVIGVRGTWGVNRHNTVSLPLVQVLIYADLSRTAGGSPTARDGKDRALRVFDPIDRLLHNVGGSLNGMSVVLDGDTKVTFVSSARSEGPTVLPVPNGDGMERLMARYQMACV